MTLNLRKVFVDDLPQAQADPEQCPECAKKGLTEYLRFHFISLYESVEKCNRKKCMFPFDRFRYRELQDPRIYRYEIIPNAEDEAPSDSLNIGGSSMLAEDDVMQDFDLSWLLKVADEDYSQIPDLTAIDSLSLNNSVHVDDIISNKLSSIATGSEEPGYSLTELTSAQPAVSIAQPVLNYDFQLSAINPTVNVLIATPIENPETPIDSPGSLEVSTVVNSSVNVAIATPIENAEQPINTPITDEVSTPAVAPPIDPPRATTPKPSTIADIERPKITKRAPVPKPSTKSTKPIKMPTPNYRFNFIRKNRPGHDTQKTASAPTSAVCSGSSTPKTSTNGRVSAENVPSSPGAQLRHEQLLRKLKRIKSLDRSNPSQTPSPIPVPFAPLPACTSTPIREPKPGTSKMSNDSDMIDMPIPGTSRTSDVSAPLGINDSIPCESGTMDDICEIGEVLSIEDGFRGFSKADQRWSRKRRISPWSPLKETSRPFRGFARADVANMQRLLRAVKRHMKLI